MTGAAAFVRNGRLDVLSAKQLGYALYSPVFASSARPVNSPGSSSSTRTPPSSTATGTASQRPQLAACAPKLAAILMTAR
jgi:hypothetical protein